MVLEGAISADVCRLQLGRAASWYDCHVAVVHGTHSDFGAVGRAHLERIPDK